MAVGVSRVGGRLGLFLSEGTVDGFFENGLGLDVLELGLEVLQASGVGGAVRATTSVGEVEVGVLDLLAFYTPV